MSEKEEIDLELGKSFQIALLNHKPEGRERFAWESFKPGQVKGPRDLPSYMIFGPLDEGTLLITEGGWSANWSDAEQKARVNVAWNKKTGMYTASQFWQGEEGSAVEVEQSKSLIEVFATLYWDGFPKNWDKKASQMAQKNYQLTWLESPQNLPMVVAAPDGVFRSISFPVMIKNIDNARVILEGIAKDGVPYGFFATATLMQQDIYYEEGVAPEWTSDVIACMSQSIGETGLVPGDVAKREEIEDKSYIYLTRFVMMLNVFVPFGHIFDMLKRIAATPMPVLKITDTPLRREQLAVVIPQGLDKVLSSFTVIDPIQGIKVTDSYIAPVVPLDDLLKENRVKQIKKLEEYSDSLINDLLALPNKLEQEEADKHTKQ